MSFPKINPRVTFLASVLATTCAFSSTAHANFHASANYYGTDKADISGSNAELSTHAVEFVAGNQWISFGVKNTAYDFSNTDVDPFDNLTKIYVDLRHRGYIYSSLAYDVGIQLGSLFEDSIDLADDYNISPRAVAGWEFRNGMTAFLGAYANFNGADNVYLPIIGLEVGRDRDLGLTGAIAYPATKIQYRFSQNLAVDATFLTVRDTYHLDNDVNKKGYFADGYLREESYGTSLGATYTFNKSVSVSGGLFSYFDRKFKLYNASGKEVDSFDTDNTTGVYIRGSMAF